MVQKTDTQRSDKSSKITTDDAVLGRCENELAIRDFLLRRGIEAAQKLAGFKPKLNIKPCDEYEIMLKRGETGQFGWEEFSVYIGSKWVKNITKRRIDSISYSIQDDDVPF